MKMEFWTKGALMLKVFADDVNGIQGKESNIMSVTH